MLKKITLWIFYAALVGLLIFGAVNRTKVKIGDSDSHITEADSGGKNESADGLEGADDPQDSSPAEESEHDMVTLTGTVASLTSHEMIVTTPDDQSVEVARRPWRFAQEQGFEPEVGDQLRLEGFYENGEFEVSALTDLTKGQSVAIRDETGHPLWASGEN